MYTLHITWTGLDKYSIIDNVTTLLLNVVLQWVVMRFPDFIGILTYGVISCVPCLRLYQNNVSSDVSGGVKVSYQRSTCQGVNINLCVSYLDNISDKQNYGLFGF